MVSAGALSFSGRDAACCVSPCATAKSVRLKSAIRSLCMVLFPSFLCRDGLSPVHRVEPGPIGSGEADVLSVKTPFLRLDQGTAAGAELAVKRPNHRGHRGPRGNAGLTGSQAPPRG